jgi:deoxyribonuclease-4
VGAHVFVGGGLTSVGLPYAERIGAEAVQVFVSNPRGWKPSPGDPAVDAAFGDACADRRVPVFVHAPYLCNFASPTDATRTNTATAVRHAIGRGRRIGAAGVVVHTGCAPDGIGRDIALERLRAELVPLLDEMRDDDPLLLLEPTAGGGTPVAGTVTELGELFAVLEGHDRLGICLDTCHAFAAGHDLAAPGGMRKLLNGLVRAVGRNRLKLVHANDSRDPAGSGRDRHANIGAGLIGAGPFAELFLHPAVRGVPVVVETPGDEPTHLAELAMLRALRDG